MRKRTLQARVRTLTAALSIALFAAACSRSSDTSDSVSVGSSPASGAGAGYPAPQRPLMAGGDERMAAQLTPALPPGSGAAANAVTNDSRAVSPESRPVSLGSPIPPMDPSGAMLIRNGQASVEVKRLDDAVAKLRQTAAQFGGFVANTSVVGGREEHRSASLELRVPSAQFDAVIASLGGLGKVESVSATAQDVGDEYVDLGARVANARHMEARLIEMLARRTGKLSDVLTVEQELRRVREEIERYDARLKWLERKTSLSSLEVALHEPLSVLDQRGPSPIAEAFAAAWTRAIGVVAWCIASLGVIVPLGLLLAGGTLLARRLLRPGTPPGVSGA